MADIFISYSSHDLDRAFSLTNSLREHGYEVWIDKSGIGAATQWSSEIATALESCRVMILLLSNASLESKNVAKELNSATELEREILPIELEPVKLSGTFLYHLAGLHRVSFDNFEAIAKALERLGVGKEHDGILNDSYQINPTLSSRKRIAVLPFDDLSPKGDSEWFSDGLTEELINTLSGLSKLQVSDRQRVREYKNSNRKLSEIAKQLNAVFLITGSVRRSDHEIKIAAQLTDISLDSVLWRKDFRGQIEDIFDIQEKVAKEITQGLKLKLTPEEEEYVEKKLTDSPEAYELFLKGSSVQGRQTKQDFIRAIEFYESATKIDGRFAVAYANLSKCYSDIYRLYDRNTDLLDKAEASAQKAIDLNPNDGSGFRALARAQLNRGDGDTALVTAENALILEPRNYLNHSQLGNINEGLGRFREASQNYESTLKINPDNLSSYYNLCLQYERLGELQRRNETAQRALPVFEKYLLRHPDDETNRMSYSFFLKYLGRVDDSIKEIESIISKPDTDSGTLYNASCAYLVMDRFDEGIKVLRRAVDAGFSDLELLRTDTDLDVIRNRDEFIHILQMGDGRLAGIPSVKKNIAQSKKINSKRLKIYTALLCIPALILFWLSLDHKKTPTNNTEVKQVMVFALTSVSPTAASEAFAATITSALRNELKKFGYINVITLPDSLRGAAGYPDRLKIAKELGVRYFIEGDLDLVDDSINTGINIRDIKIDEVLVDFPLKGAKGDISILVKGMAEDIAEVLGPHSILESGLCTDESSKNLDSYKHIVIARKFSDWPDQALLHYDLAVELDSLNDETWAERSVFLASSAFEVDSLGEWAALALKSAHHALLIAPNKPQGHVALSRAMFLNWRNGGKRDSSLFYSAVREAKKAVTLSGSMNITYLLNLSYIEAYGNDSLYEDAIQLSKYVNNMDQGNYQPYERLAMGLTAEKKTLLAKARVILNRLIRIYRDKLSLKRFYISIAINDIRDIDSTDIRQRIDKLVASTNSRLVYNDARITYLQLHDPGQALQMLEKLKHTMRTQSWINYKALYMQELLSGFYALHDVAVSARFNRIIN